MYKPVVISSVAFLPFLLRAARVLKSNNVKGVGSVSFPSDALGFLCPTGVGEMGKVGRIGQLVHGIEISVKSSSFKHVLMWIKKSKSSSITRI
jgi:hypothetical protein